MSQISKFYVPCIHETQIFVLLHDIKIFYVPCILKTEKLYYWNKVMSLCMSLVYIKIELILLYTNLIIKWRKAWNKEITTKEEGQGVSSNFLKTKGKNEKKKRKNINEGKIDTIYIDKQNISLY